MRIANATSDLNLCVEGDQLCHEHCLDSLCKEVLQVDTSMCLELRE